MDHRAMSDHLDDRARKAMQMFVDDPMTSLVVVPFYDSRPIGGHIYLVRWVDGFKAVADFAPMGFAAGVQIVDCIYAPGFMPRNRRGHRSWIGRNAAEIAAALAPICPGPIDTNRICLGL